MASACACNQVSFLSMWASRANCVGLDGDTRTRCTCYWSNALITQAKSRKWQQKMWYSRSMPMPARTLRQTLR